MAEERHCLHEADLAVLARELRDNTDIVKKLVEKIDGNGKPGIRSDIAVLKAATSRIWWFVGVLSGGVSAVAFYIIRCGLTN